MNKDLEQIIAKDFSTTNIEELEKFALLGEQIAGIAHELNNPLSAILGYSEMLQTMELEPKAKKYADNIYISAIRAAKIAESLLTFLKKKEIKFVPLNLNEVIEKTLSLFDYQLRANSISVRLDLSSTMPIKGDFHKLQQIFFNLIMNAIQSLEIWDGEKTIRISTSSLENKVRVMVSDSGPGIDNFNISKVFSTFHTTKNSGTGLGLSIVHSLVKEHGGEISLISDAKGCSFLIDFSMTSDTVDDCGSVIENMIQENKRVLIVDDDELVINAIAGIIKLLGYTVTFTTKPFDAIQELRNNDFDIILVDYKMPAMNGIDFIKCASEFVNIKKFILITGYIGLDTQEIHKKYNIPILQKPIGLDELKHALLGGF